MGIGVYIIGLIIFSLLLHFIIRNAINHSELNQTLKEIRELLKEK